MLSAVNPRSDDSDDELQSVDMNTRYSGPRASHLPPDSEAAHWAEAVVTAGCTRHQLLMALEAQSRTFQVRHPQTCVGKFCCCLSQSVLWGVALALFMLLPLFIEIIRTSKVSTAQMRLDGEVLLHLKSFRDVPWEMWSWIHKGMVESGSWYYTASVPLWLVNMFMWYYSFTRRFLFERQWDLWLQLMLLLAFSFFSNCISWMPPPAESVHKEAEWVTYFVGFVIPTAHTYMSPRVGFSILLLRDRLDSRQERFKPWMRTSFVVVYSIWACIYLWATRQMYSFALMLNLVAAAAAHNVSWWILRHINTWLLDRNNDEPSADLQRHRPPARYDPGNHKVQFEVDENTPPTRYDDPEAVTIHSSEDEDEEVGLQGHKRVTEAQLRDHRVSAADYVAEEDETPRFELTTSADTPAASAAEIEREVEMNPNL